MHRLALVMIVRDEARCLERCLASARPWVDEMLVLDTGSVETSDEVGKQLAGPFQLVTERAAQPQVVIEGRHQRAHAATAGQGRARSRSRSRSTLA